MMTVPKTYQVPFRELHIVLGVSASEMQRMDSKDERTESHTEKRELRHLRHWKRQVTLTLGALSSLRVIPSDAHIYRVRSVKAFGVEDAALHELRHIFHKQTTLQSETRTRALPSGSSGEDDNLCANHKGSS